MGKDVQLNSSEWIELVFEGKNKSYGAYHLRQTSWKRHLIAVGAMLAFTIVVALLPTLIETVKKARENLGGINAEVELAAVEQKVPEENIIKEQAAPVEPPPLLKSSLKFTPPVITDDENVRDDEQMLSQKDLQESKVTISIATVEGVDDVNAVDIAELQEHKVIVAEEQQPFVAVEQMPSFPGGELALRQWIAEHTHYPALMAENNIQGRVIVRFVVTAKGKVDKVEILQSTVDKVGDVEAVRVVKSLPDFIPGRHNGKAVPVWHTVPIIFKLE